MRQLLFQIRDLQNKVNYLSEKRYFHDPETPSSSGASHVPTQPLAVPSTRSIHCRDSGLPPNTRNAMGTSGDVFESLPARQDPPSALFENSRNLASSSCGLRPEATGATLIPERYETRATEFVDTCHVPCFLQGAGVFDHTGGNYSQHGMMDYPRFPISKLHLGKFPDSMEFQSWKVIFKNEVCSKTADPHLTMQWIKEVEIATSTDGPLTSRSIVGRTDFSDYDMLDAMNVSAFKKRISTSMYTSDEE